MQPRCLDAMKTVLVALACASIGCFASAERPMSNGVPDRLATVAHPPPQPGAHVYVRGEVGRPGRYTLLAPATALQVLDAAGWLTKLADPHIVVTRRLDDGRVKRWVVEIDAVLDGRVPDDEVIAEDTLDVLGRLELPPGVWVFSRPELPAITLSQPQSSCSCTPIGKAKKPIAVYASE